MLCLCVHVLLCFTYIVCAVYFLTRSGKEEGLMLITKRIIVNQLIINYLCDFFWTNTYIRKDV